MKREDGLLLRRIPSKIANWIIRRSTKVDLSDYGCTLKVYRRDVAKNLGLYRGSYIDLYQSSQRCMGQRLLRLM